MTAARERALIAVVDGLEAELRRMRLWEPVPPSQELLASPQPFCVDTLAAVAVAPVDADPADAQDLDGRRRVAHCERDPSVR